MGRGESAAQGECPRTGQTNTHTMPLILELKYEYFISDWPGRIKLAELLLALLCMMCSAPAYEGPQHWFLIVVVLAFLAMLAHFCEMDGGEYQYWVDSNIAAGVLGLINDIIYGLGAYLIYVDWKKGPVGVAAPPAAQLPT